MIKVCEICGKEYRTFPSLKQRFCSRKCQGVWRSQQTGEKAANWQGGMVLHSCEICGAQFAVPMHVKRAGLGRFCSQGCSGVANRNSLEWTCQTCGQKFMAPASQGERFYCSKNCQGIAFRKDSNPNWCGGKSYEPYSPDFDEEFKQRIRERDLGQCVVCRLPGCDVHHIDYDKEHTAEGNCILLCKTCHGVTNHNRIYWQAALTNLLQARLTGAAAYA